MSKRDGSKSSFEKELSETLIASGITGPDAQIDDFIALVISGGAKGKDRKEKIQALFDSLASADPRIGLDAVGIYSVDGECHMRDQVLHHMKTEDENEDWYDYFGIAARGIMGNYPAVAGSSQKMRLSGKEKTVGTLSAIRLSILADDDGGFRYLNISPIAPGSRFFLIVATWDMSTYHNRQFRKLYIGLRKDLYAIFVDR